MKKSARPGPFVAGVLMASASLLGTTAYGQSQPEDAAATEPQLESVATIPVPEKAVAAEEASAAEGEVVQLDEVIVTSTKREKSLRDIPASISQYDVDKLANQGKLGLNDYLQEKPGVTVAQIAPGLIRVTVRGITTFSSPTAAAPQGTGMYVDDVPFNDAYIANIQPDLSAFDLASVELLKGPQGTLFGGGGLSGAVRFVTQEPKLGVWEGRSFGLWTAPTDGTAAWTAGVAVNAPVYKDKLALRVGYVKRNHPGVTDWTREPVQKDVDTGSGKQERAILLWQPLDGLNVKFTHLFQDFDAQNETTTSDTPDRHETSRLILPRTNINDFKMDALQLTYDVNDIRFFSLSSKLSKNWTTYSDATALIAGAPPPGYPIALGAFLTVEDNSNAFSQEFRVQSTNSEGFQWLVGLYYYDFNLQFNELIDTIANQRLHGASGAPDDVTYAPLAMQTSLLYATTHPKASEKALFFDLTDTFWEKLELSAGARLYKTRVHGGFHGTGVLGRVYGNGAEIDYSDNDISEAGVSPKLSATWHFSRELSTYVLASRGFRFGGLQSAPSTQYNHVPKVYKSDKIWNYEWGFRTAWFGNTLHFDPTVFYIDYQDPQIGQSTQGVPIGYTTNVGGAKSYGGEFNLRWLTPVPGLMAELDGGITKALTTEAFTASDGEVIPAGAYMPGGSRSQYSASIDYVVPFISVVTVAAHAGYSYIGKTFTDIQNQHPVNDFGTSSAGLVFSVPMAQFQPKLALGVTNISNVTRPVYWETGKPLSQTGEYQTYILNAPRTFTARISLDF